MRPRIEKVSAFVHHAQVSGAEPAVLGVGGFIGRRILVVSQGDVGTAGLDFSGHALGVRGLDPYLVDGFAAGPGHVPGGHLECQERAGFRHAVTHGVGEADLAEGHFHLPVEGSAADDDGPHAPAKVGKDFLADGLVKGHAYARNRAQKFAGTGVEHGTHPGGIDFFHHHGNGDDKGRTHLLHCLHQKGRRRGFPEKTDLVSGAAGVDELHGQAVDVGEGQHGDNGLGLVGDVLLAVLHNV